MTRCQMCLLLLLGLHGLVIQSKGASVSTTRSDDQTQGNNLKEIIENLITDDTCTQFMKQLAPDCYTLTVSSNVDSILNFCTQEDYNKLRAAICNNTPTPTPAQSSSPSSTTTTTSRIAPASAPSSSSNQVQDNPVLNSEQAQRDQIKQVMKNEISGMCSERAEGIVTDDRPLVQACDVLESLEGTITGQGCTQQEYNKLQEVICDYVGMPALNSEQAQRDDIKRVTENEISDFCSERVSGLAPDDEPLDQICEVLEFLEGTITTQGCTQQEYNKLHEVTCNYVNSSDSESTAKPPTTAPPTPKPTSSSSTTTPKATADPTTSSPNTPYQGQTSAGIRTAKQVTDQGLHDPTIPSNGASVSPTLSNDQTQGNNLKELIENLINDDRCTQFMEQVAPDCSTLAQNRATILAFCTQEDYNKLHAAICDNNPTPNPVQSSSPSSTPTTTLKTSTTTTTLKTSTTTTTSKTTAAAPGTSAPNQGQNTPAPNSEQAQRDKIEEVIENELSSDRCKGVVGAQASDDTIPLDVACTKLESFASLVSIVGCTQDDYDKLHAVICDDVREQAQRDKIKDVIENELSSDLCKGVVGAQSSDDNTPLDEACTKLESFASIATIVGCTQNDYDKLHAVMCDYVALSDSRSTVKQPTTTEWPTTTASPTKTSAPTTTATIQGVLANDVKQREVIKCFFENELSSHQCKSAMELLVTEDMDLQAGCTLIESLEPAMPVVGCTEDDYTKLHQAICDYGKTCSGAKVKGFNVKKWQDYVLSVIDNQLTQQCATLPRSQATEDATPEKACEMFDLGRSALEDMCTEDELQLLNEALCGYKNNTDKRILDETKVVIDAKLTSSCKTAISRHADVFSSNVSQSCTIVSQAGPGLIDNHDCTQADIDVLNNTICYGDSFCDPPYTGICYSGEEPSPRVRRVRTVIGKLTEQCKNVMTNSFSQLSQAPPDACQTLEATRKDLIDGNVCTELDFVKLQQVVCMDVPLGTYDGAENEIRDNALFVIQNDLTASCHNTLSPQAVWYAGNRDKGCDVIQIAKRCTQEDYDKLDNALCTAG